MLSREFLIDRGYCCGHGCLMCPYEPKHTKDNTIMAEQWTGKVVIVGLKINNNTMITTIRYLNHLKIKTNAWCVMNQHYIVNTTMWTSE